MRDAVKFLAVVAAICTVVAAVEAPLASAGAEWLTATITEMAAGP